jgi:hypothetical protein
MSEKFTAYFQRLEGLATEELDRSVAELVLAENRHVALVIAHIAAISRRRGDLERGYPNLNSYSGWRLAASARKGEERKPHAVHQGWRPIAGALELAGTAQAARLKPHAVLEVLERALDLALERKDPQKRHERRLERERRRAAPSAEPRPGEAKRLPLHPASLSPWYLHREAFRRLWMYARPWTASEDGN